MYFARYKKSRYWGVYEQSGELVGVCVYKKGAVSFLLRLGEEPREVKCEKPSAAVSAGRNRSNRGSRYSATLYRTNP